MYLIILVFIKFKGLYSLIKKYWLKYIHNLQGHNVSNGMKDTNKERKNCTSKAYTIYMSVVKTVCIGIGLIMYSAMTSSAICK